MNLAPERTNYRSMEDIYGGKVRVRVCGLLVDERGILLLKHTQLGPKGHIWAPPGGGVEFGQSAEEVLIREIREETGLIVNVGAFLFVNEYRDKKYHAIELFFEVQAVGGTLSLGHDPELPMDQQILTEIKFFDDLELASLDRDNLHNILQQIISMRELRSLRGFFRFQRRE